MAEIALGLVADGGDLEPGLMAMSAGTVDRALGQMARSAPDKIAIIDRGAVVSYASLDAEVSHRAGLLRRRLPAGRHVVAISSVLSRDFVISFFAVLRSGNVAAPVNPLLYEQALAHNLNAARAALILADEPVADRLRRVRGHLPHLIDVLPLDAGAPARPDAASEPGDCEYRLPDDVACILFTSGTTGDPKTVLLTQANLMVNAGQVVQAHRLGASSVTLNHLPTFHIMHMTSAIVAGATQVLCPEPEPRQGVALANRLGATHYYSLPVRLIKLAADPGLPQLTLETVTMIASGGSALPVAANQVLSRHFGAPVVQGYGLAETSPLTHCDLPGSNVPGSVGRPVALTQCRIVDVASREVLAARATGEVQVRGPQVMLGYLRDGTAEPVADDGWLSTGDIGWMDDGGRLFLVDRVKDVFKCDNWMVSPAEIERVLADHPLVRESVVVGRPDAASGAVACALVVLDGGGAADVSSAVREITAYVNSRVPYFQQLRHVQAVAEIPRGASGKVRRGELAAQLSAGAGDGD